ncbi:hypothetical protein H3Z85_17055 [Chryseobacterium indologenes]|uniref:DUF7009 family protein n=1 Tax=Chryseobacterium indologenes TaxID=253 RepID=UPI0003E0869F|nr:hypothetical protein [Chryseobacterium indologenes]QPQ51049.1 hypothetical protein H3Z85_17055 [Chryseobacterium indologenes]SFK05746.1 hypothetical protein SAMN05421692_3298 [Chryseobacterium indologenes]SUX49402.1 Uncharacterised protein [Chryseobacterium indologenes]VFA40289.1 Uncharacterised protein [Chryseobacterium indologenes]GAE65794.1 hypothetical protein CIN01S_12_01660 [Chryseobacterium indologenes NBRC 14944]
MKIRIKDNSIRFRLTQSEVAELGKNGIVSSVTEFVERPFIYRIEKTEDSVLSAAFIENRMVMKMPAAMVDELVSTDTVGFDGQVGSVKLLVEKDFVCIDNSLEDQSDNYPNPNLTC